MGVVRFDRAHGIATVVYKTKPRVYTAVDHKQSPLSNWLVLCTLVHHGSYIVIVHSLYFV